MKKQEQIIKNEKALLRFLKEDVKNWEDEFGTVETFNIELARYFKVENKVHWKKIVIDPKAQWNKKKMLIVKTPMFWWQAKHIPLQIYREQKKWFNEKTW